MNMKKEQICRLCLIMVAQNDSTIIDKTTRKMFKVLSLKVNLNVSQNPVICKTCKDSLKKCFDFKLACANTEEIIFSFAVEKNRATFELKDVYEDEIEIVDGNFICRFCSHYLSGNNFVLLETLMNDDTFKNKLQLFMPDMDFNIIQNPVICTSCGEDLESYINFINTCLDVEDKITKYCRSRDAVSLTQVKLGEVGQFLLKNVESDYAQKQAIKQDVCNGEIVKGGEVSDIKENEVNFNKNTCATPSDKPGNELNASCGLKSENKIKKSSKASTRTSSLIKKFKCTACPYQTQHKSSLTSHLLIHKDVTELEKHKCSMCSYETIRKGDLTIHTLTHNDITKVKTFECPTCTYRAKRKCSLKLHMLIHKDISEVRAYKCSICSYQAKQKGSLKRHTLIHKDVTELEMYKCPTCAYETKHKSDLKKHELIHVRETRVYKCSKCTFQTGRKSNLICHVSVHRDVRDVKMYKCFICDYRVNRKFELNLHIYNHEDVTEVEMYACSMCMFQTKHQSSLKRHTLLHKNFREVTVFKCSRCSYQSEEKRSLKRHKCKSLKACDDS